MSDVSENDNMPIFTSHTDTIFKRNLIFFLLNNDNIGCNTSSGFCEMLSFKAKIETISRDTLHLQCIKMQHFKLEICKSIK